MSGVDAHDHVLQVSTPTNLHSCPLPLACSPQPPPPGGTHSLAARLLLQLTALREPHKVAGVHWVGDSAKKAGERVSWQSAVKSAHQHCSLVLLLLVACLL